jgi:hypothetical protein
MMQDTIWTWRDGHQVLVSQMADSHLHNCIAKILRHPNWRREYLDRLELELVIRSIQRSGR